MAATALRGIDAYRQTEVQSRSPVELVVMLYDGLIRFTGQAREAMLRRDIPRRHQNVTRALDILSELQSTLNMQAGGELANSLDRLYNYLRDRLVEATVRQDVKPLDEAIRVVTTLREGWVAISAQVAPRFGWEMSESALATLINQYRAGLEAEIVILRRLQQTAARQHDATAARDFDGLNRAADERDRLMAGLVNVEGQLREVRRVLAESPDQARALPGYREAAALHSEAIALVSGILKTDEASVEALANAELVRRDAARAMEQGETTLAAYRRVMSAPPGATLVDKRG